MTVACKICNSLEIQAIVLKLKYKEKFTSSFQQNFDGQGKSILRLENKTVILYYKCIKHWIFHFFLYLTEQMNL